jgi:hypothetical protein
MAIKPEIIRQAKKFLENKNLSIKVIKEKVDNGEANTSDKKAD